MFLFEKSFMGAYCNSLYDLKKGSAPFHVKAELKQTAQAKILILIYSYESGPTKSSIIFTTKQLISLLVKTTTIWATPSILTMFLLLPLTLLKITNGSLCYRSFVLNTSSLY